MDSVLSHTLKHSYTWFIITILGNWNTFSYFQLQFSILKGEGYIYMENAKCQYIYSKPPPPQPQKNKLKLNKTSTLFV